MESANRLEAAFNGEEAIKTAAHQRPDIILMDLRIPVMGGFEVIEHLKSDPRTATISILAVAAQAVLEDRERAIRAGADGFVTKPISIEMLKREIRRLCSAKNSISGVLV